MSAARRLGLDLRDVEALRARLDATRSALRRELSQPRPDSQTLAELLAEERLVARQEQSAATRLEQALTDVLTPRQVLRVHSLGPSVREGLLAKLVS